MRAGRKSPCPYYSRNNSCTHVRVILAAFMLEYNGGSILVLALTEKVERRSNARGHGAFERMFRRVSLKIGRGSVNAFRQVVFWRI